MKKFESLKVILSIVIILMISYSLYIYICENDDFVNWLNTLMSTLISVSLALLIAIYIFYYQMNLVERDTKDRFIPLIESNLISIWKGLTDLSHARKIRFRNGEEVTLYLIIFQDIIFEQAIIANVFNETETVFLLSMRSSIDYNNKVTEKVINMDPLFIENPDNYEKNIKELKLNNKLSRKRIKETIKSANKYFKFNKLDNEMINIKRK